MCTCKAPFMRTRLSSKIYTDTWSNLRKHVASLRMQTRANVCKLALRKLYIDCFNSFFTYILIRLSFQCSIFILLQALPLSRVGQALTMLLYGTRSWLRRSRSTYVLRVLEPIIRLLPEISCWKKQFCISYRTSNGNKRIYFIHVR